MAKVRVINPFELLAVYTALCQQCLALYFWHILLSLHLITLDGINDGTGV